MEYPSSSLILPIRVQTGSEESAWIGLRQDARGNKYVWTWVDGSPADVASWKYGSHQTSIA